MKVYISGPVTGTVDYVARFEKAEKKLNELGFVAINPVRVNGGLPEDTTYKQYMKMSIEMLKMADTIFLLDGWQASNGARIELSYALKHGYTVLVDKLEDE